MAIISPSTKRPRPPNMRRGCTGPNAAKRSARVSASTTSSGQAASGAGRDAFRLGRRDGDGFAAARMKGSEHNDCFVNGEGKTATNGAGGINGGISNGNPVVFRIAVKPTSSIAKKQYTFNFATGRMEEFVVKGRHDACIALRCPVVVEAIAAIALANN